MSITRNLTWKHFLASKNGFIRALVQMSGPTEVLLIVGGSTFSDGKAAALAQAIAATVNHITIFRWKSS